MKEKSNRHQWTKEEMESRRGIVGSEFLVEMQKAKNYTLAEQMLKIIGDGYSSAAITLDTSHGIKAGDTFTIEGVFKKRTFFQWLTRKQKILQVHRVATVDSGTTITIKPPFMRVVK